LNPSPSTPFRGHGGQGRGAPTPSYISVTGKEHNSSHFKCPTFELLEGMKQLIWEDEMPKENPMDIDPETNHPKSKCTWEPEKCIPQATIAPKYTIISPRIEDQKQYMRYFSLIGKLLGLAF